MNKETRQTQLTDKEIQEAKKQKRKNREMNLNAFWICLCVVIDLVDQMRALLLFVRDETTSQQFPVQFESPTTATLADLLQEIARWKAVNRSETGMVLSFQGEQLTHLPEQQLLADIGLSNECIISVDFLPILQLQWNLDDPRFHGHDELYQVSGRDVLQWDTNKDITQFRWLQEMKYVCIRFYDQDREHREHKKHILYQLDGEILTSHAYEIVRIASEQHGVDGIPEEQWVRPRHLKQAQYAKDLLIAPVQAGYMDFYYFTRFRTHGWYEFPAGYGLLLRYKNATRSIV